MTLNVFIYKNSLNNPLIMIILDKLFEIDNRNCKKTNVLPFTRKITSIKKPLKLFDLIKTEG